MFRRMNFAVVAAEALGTAILTFSILAVSRSAVGVPYFVALGVGLTMAVLVMSIGLTSGAHVNPAVTVGLWSVKKISHLRAAAYIAAQFVGAALAYKLYVYLVATGIQNIAGPEFKWQVLVAELVGTMIFTFGIAVAVFNKYEGGKLAAAIGGSLAVGILVAGVASNGILNPAAALGVQSWSKAYVVGPILGGLIGMNLYSLLFADKPSSILVMNTAVKAPVTKKSPAKKSASSKKKK